MDPDTFRQAATLLSGEYSLAILRQLRDGEWHLSSEVARDLHIHVSTASRFLHRLAEMGLIERRRHDARTSEYRVPSPRLQLEVDLTDDATRFPEAVDFYVSYFHFLFQQLRQLDRPEVVGSLENTLTTNHEALRKTVFEQLITGSSGGIDHLRDLMAAVHRDLWAACSESLGKPQAQKIFQAALRNAMDGHPDLALRCGLTRPLGG